MDKLTLEIAVKNHLNRKGYTQAEVARKFNISADQLNKWIKGINRMPAYFIPELSHLLDLTDEEQTELFSLAGHGALSVLSKDHRVEIMMHGDFFSLSAEQKDYVKKILAALLEIQPQNVKIFQVLPGSIIFDLGLPAEAVQRLRALLQSNNQQLHRLRIEKVLLDKESDEPETWAIKDGKFYQVNLTQTTTIIGERNIVGDVTISGNVGGPVIFGDQIVHTAPQQPTVAALIERARNLLGQSSYKTAVEICEQALQEEPEQPEANLLIAIALMYGRGADQLRDNIVRRVERHLQSALDDPATEATALAVLGIVKYDHYIVNGLFAGKPTLKQIKQQLEIAGPDNIDPLLLKHVKASRAALKQIDLDDSYG